MRSSFIVLALFTAAPAVAQTSKLDTVSPAQAIGHLAATSPTYRTVVQFKVQSGAPAHGGFYLNSEKDFHSPANLEVTIRPSAMSGLTKKFGADLKRALVGKTIKVIGVLHRRPVAHGKANANELIVTHAGQILSVS